MANKTKAELITQADEIKNETQQGANTANRVGTMLNDIIDSTTIGGGVYAMDLDSLPYSIQNGGVYYVINGDIYDIALPTPSEFDGQMVYIINRVGANANFDSINRPHELDGNMVTSIPNNTTFQCCSINGQWVIILQFSI